MLEQFNQFHKTKTGYGLFAVVELILLYILISICINTANMFAYFAAFVVLIGLLRNILLLGALINKEKSAGHKK